MKKIFSKGKNVFLFVFVMVFFMFATITTVIAVTSLPTISSSTPITCYTLASSGNVYAYTSSDLQTKTGGYIACSTDECKIIQINGNAVQVTYPVTGGTKTAWFARSAFTSCNISSGAVEKWTQTTQITTYRRSDGGTSFGSISAQDVCYKLATSGNYTQVIYPVSSGYKMGWIKTSDINSGSSSADWQFPMTNAYCTWSDKTNMSWSGYNYSSSRPTRTDHLGIDIYGSSSTVYAAADGEVVAYSTSNSGANGRYVIIRHTIDGQTVYSFYAHLSSVNSAIISDNTVNKGDRIGVAGGSGYNSDSYYGTHLHFAIVDTLWSSGGYYGYADSFTGNTKVYSGVTYYNPVYVVNNNTLP